MQEYNKNRYIIRANMIGSKVITLPFHVGNAFLSREDRENFPFIYTKEMADNEGKIGEIVHQEEDRVLVALPSGVFWYPYQSIQLAVEHLPIHLLRVENEYLYFDMRFVKGDYISYEKFGEQLVIESDSEITEFGWKCKFRFWNSEEFPLGKLTRGVRYYLLGHTLNT